MKNLIALCVALCAFTPPAIAQNNPLGNDALHSHRMRVQSLDTGWIDVMPDLEYVVDGITLRPEIPVAAFNMPRGGRLEAVIEFRYGAWTQNKWAAPVDNYQIGSGMFVRAGEVGQQVCSNLCGGALSGFQGTYYAGPADPMSGSCQGFPAGAHDYHYMPVHFAFPVDWGVVAPGMKVVTFSSYASMQEWDHVPSPFPSHGYAWGFAHFQMRATFRWIDQPVP